jgi:predicted dehydrogenase
VSRPLAVGVIGVGHLGQHHARIYAGLPNVRLVGVVDLDAERARDVAARTGTEAVATCGELLERVEAVSIAVPTVQHRAVAVPFLARGIACLVEKPLAEDLASGRALTEAAARSGAALMTGHTERFNPAFVAARARVRRPGFIEAQRLGTFVERSLDVDVILDLMIHDIDAVLDLTGERPVSVDAVGVAALTDKIDIANARLRFPSGCAANLTASRMSLGKVRKLRVFQPDAYVTVDLASREALVYSLVRTAGRRPEVRGESLAVPEIEPLAAELAEFVAAVRERRRPGCSGEEGLAALEVALAVRDQIGRPVASAENPDG